jgi:hypothetical protein
MAKTKLQKQQEALQRKRLFYMTCHFPCWVENSPEGDRFYGQPHFEQATLNLIRRAKEAQLTIEGSKDNTCCNSETMFQVPEVGVSFFSLKCNRELTISEFEKELKKQGFR